MKTLVELYSGLATANPPALPDIYFKAAFPENIEKEAKRLRRLSEDLFEDFYKDWEARLRAELTNELEAGSSPHTILKLVHYLTVAEFEKLLVLTDEFLTGDKEALLILKSRELESHVMTCAQKASEIFKELYQEHQENARKGKILRPALIQPV